MKSVRLIRKDENAVSPVIATILMVAITVVLAAVLYVLVSGLIDPIDRVPTMVVNIRAVGTNWSVEVVEAPTGALLASTYLLIRDPNGVIALARTAWSSLTQGNWATYGAIYQDANPGTAEVRAGDGLLIDRARYPPGSALQISDEESILASRTL